MVEAASLGGTCVNNGCVPKQPTWCAANLTHAVEDAHAFGIPTLRGSIDWDKPVAGRERYIRNPNGDWDGCLDDSGISRIDGYARFVGARTIQVGDESYDAEHVVIATGGRPIVPPVSAPRNW